MELNIYFYTDLENISDEGASWLFLIFNRERIFDCCLQLSNHTNC